jgi:hypothetical protein
VDARLTEIDGDADTEALGNAEATPYNRWVDGSGIAYLEDR